jgi:hypothetical protein
MFRQLARKGFWTFVLPNLEANRVGSMPILYRLANANARPNRLVPTWMLILGAIGLAASFALRKWRRASRPTSLTR